MKDQVLLALLGAALSAIAAYFAARRSFQQQLLAAYDEGVRAARIQSYQVLWTLTGAFPRYWEPGAVDAPQLATLGAKLRDWYFSGGGMFLTDRSRDVYFAFQQQLVERHRELAATPATRLTPEHYAQLRQAGSAVRSSLCTDLSSRMQPAFSPRNPATRF